MELIKSFEGLRLMAYQDSVGVWTIGYGHTRFVSPNQVIDETTAQALLREDLDQFEAGVSKLVTTRINENQFSALVSFAFNLGLGNLKKSTLLIYVNNRQFEQAAQEFPRWDKAGGVVLPGLHRRRMDERELFLKEVV